MLQEMNKLTCKNLPENEIVGLQIESVGEVITKVISVDADEVILENPFILSVGQNGLGLQPIGMISALNFQETNNFLISLNKDKIVYAIKVSEKIKREYINGTSSIKIASADSIKK